MQVAYSDVQQRLPASHTLRVPRFERMQINLVVVGPTSLFSSCTQHVIWGFEDEAERWPEERMIKPLNTAWRDAEKRESAGRLRKTTKLNSEGHRCIMHR